MSSGPGEARQVVDDRDHRVVVAVRDHAALRRPGRPGRVDVREEVVLLDPLAGLTQRVRVLGRVGAPTGGEVVEIGVGEHVAQLRRIAAHRLDLRALGLVLAEHADRLRVPEDVAGVLRRAVRVDRGADRADRAEREVEERPLDAARAQDREGVALADAERQQPVGVALDPLRRLGPRQRLPLVAVLDQVGRRRPPGCRSVAPEPLDRSLLFHERTLWRREAVGKGESVRSH